MTSIALDALVFLAKVIAGILAVGFFGLMAGAFLALLAEMLRAIWQGFTPVQLPDDKPTWKQTIRGPLTRDWPDDPS